MVDNEGIWSRGGSNVEELPDPFAPVGPPPGSPDAQPLDQKPKRKRRWPLVLYAIAGLFFVTLIWLIVTAPLSRALEPLDDPAILLVSQEGRPIARRGAVKELPVDVTRLDPLTPAAFVAIEDRRFYGHWGIDPRGIGRAMIANARAGRVRQGGSTITQQLAKTSFLSSDRSLKRKAQEVIIAFWLEAWLSKEEILSRYLSSVYFGDGVYGLARGVETLFRTRAGEPQPGAVGDARGRRAGAFAPCADEQSQARAGAQQAGAQGHGGHGRDQPRRARTARPARPIHRSSKIPTGTYFADWVAPEARDAFEADFGEVKVKTTLDADLQRHGRPRRLAAAAGDMQAALVAMRPDGRVVAMVGGKSYKDSPFNRATQARRQPGSAFKLFVYLAALRAGWTPDSMIEDRPITIDGWTPANNDGVYRGEITLREAFARSSNAATVRLSESVGRANVMRAARELGITTPLPNSPSLALGTAGVSLLELTSAYAAVASGRYPIRARGLPDKPNRAGFGGLLQSAEAWIRAATGRRCSTCFMRRRTMARANVRRSPFPTFGKTGTSQDNRDALFIGFAGNLVVGVWVGRDDDKPLGRKVSGGTVPAQIWRNFMVSALASRRPRGPDLPAEFKIPRAHPAAPRAREPASRGVERRRRAAPRRSSASWSSCSNELKSLMFINLSL